jgi:thiol-disulfide isomerase/thioredoxin
MGYPQQGPYRISVHFVHIPPAHQGKVLFLWRHVGNELLRLDSLPLTQQQLSFTAPAPGLYKLGFYPQIAQQIALGAEQDVIVVATPSQNGSNFNFRVATLDQQALDRFNAAKTEYERAYGLLNREYQSLVSQVQNQDSLLRSITQRGDSLAKRFNRQMDSLRTESPNTYAGKVLSRLAYTVIPPRSGNAEAEGAYRRAHFFDSFSFADSALLFNDFFYLKVFQYLQEVPQQGTSNFLLTVDSLMQRASANPTVYDWMANYLVEVFGLRGPDEVVRHLRDKYFPRVRRVADRTRQTFSRLDNLRPGQQAPELAMPDSNGTIRRLSQNLGQSLTLLYVFSSTCSHCREESPVVYRLFQKYKDAGFAVYAVSLDQHRDMWLSFVRDNGLAWINVSELNGFQSSVMLPYGIRRTPYCALIDHTGRLAKVDLMTEDLPSVLREHFGY